MCCQRRRRRPHHITIAILLSLLICLSQLPEYVLSSAGWSFLPNQQECKITCLNGGVCAYETDEPANHKCICFIGLWEGDRCEIAIVGGGGEMSGSEETSTENILSTSTELANLASSEANMEYTSHQTTSTENGADEDNSIEDTGSEALGEETTKESASEVELEPGHSTTRQYGDLAESSHSQLHYDNSNADGGSTSYRTSAEPIDQSYSTHIQTFTPHQQHHSMTTPSDETELTTTAFATTTTTATTPTMLETIHRTTTGTDSREKEEEDYEEMAAKLDRQHPINSLEGNDEEEEEEIPPAPAFASSTTNGGEFSPTSTPSQPSSASSPYTNGVVLLDAERSGVDGGSDDFAEPYSNPLFQYENSKRTATPQRMGEVEEVTTSSVVSWRGTQADEDDHTVKPHPHPHRRKKIKNAKQKEDDYEQRRETHQNSSLATSGVRREEKESHSHSSRDNFGSSGGRWMMGKRGSRGSGNSNNGHPYSYSHVGTSGGSGTVFGSSSSTCTAFLLIHFAFFLLSSPLLLPLHLCRHLGH